MKTEAAYLEPAAAGRGGDASWGGKGEGAGLGAAGRQPGSRVRDVRGSRASSGVLSPCSLPEGCA